VVIQPRNQCAVQSFADFFRKWSWLGITVDFNRLARCVYNDPTVVTFGEMLFQFDADARAKLAIQIFREFGN
jgi:hypothetical protein